MAQTGPYARINHQLYEHGVLWAVISRRLQLSPSFAHSVGNKLPLMMFPDYKTEAVQIHHSIHHKRRVMVFRWRLCDFRQKFNERRARSPNKGLISLVTTSLHEVIQVEIQTGSENLPVSSSSLAMNSCSVNISGDIVCKISDCQQQGKSPFLFEAL